MKNIILVGIGVLAAAALTVIGYLWYTTQKSPSIMDGGYDREMEAQSGVSDTEPHIVP